MPSFLPPPSKLCRRQYRELWSLRASYAESEENKLIEEGAQAGASGGNAGQSQTEGVSVEEKEDQIKKEQKLNKSSVDSGFKSMDTTSGVATGNRKDYSIDMKTEEIYRKFTSTSSTESTESSTVKLASSAHPSIEEEEEEDDMVEIFF